MEVIVSLLFFLLIEGEKGEGDPSCRRLRSRNSNRNGIGNGKHRFADTQGEGDLVAYGAEGKKLEGQ